MLRYTIVLTPEPDGGAYNVSVPAMPGCLTWGVTEAEALANAREAIALHLGGYAERGRPFPVHRRPRKGGKDAPPAIIASVEVPAGAPVGT